MKKFGVFLNGEPLSTRHAPFANEFDDLDTALDYATGWCSGYGLQKEALQLNIPYDYNGYGDTIEVREIEE